MYEQLWQQLRHVFYFYFSVSLFYLLSFPLEVKVLLDLIQPAQKYVNYCALFKVCQLDSEVGTPSGIKGPRLCDIRKARKVRTFLEVLISICFLLKCAPRKTFFMCYGN